MLVTRSFQGLCHFVDMQSRSSPRFLVIGFLATVAMDRRQVFLTSLGWRRRVFDDLGRIVKHHGWALASRLKFGRERQRMGEFPRETRPMLCIGKTPVTFVFAASPQKRSWTAPRMGVGARCFCGWRKATIPCRMQSLRHGQTTDASLGGRGRDLGIMQPSQRGLQRLRTDVDLLRCPNGRS